MVLFSLYTFENRKSRAKRVARAAEGPFASSRANLSRLARVWLSLTTAISPAYVAGIKKSK